jgi:hypothetical protein
MLPKFTFATSPAALAAASTTAVPYPAPTNAQSFASPSFNADPRVKATSFEGLAVGVFAGVIAILL